MPNERYRTRKLIAGATLMLMLSGCANMPTATDEPISGPVLCRETENLRIEHARGLLDDGGPTALATGRALLQTLQAACDED